MTGDGGCPRCRTDSVLAVLRLPATWANQAGGAREVVLCARCDAGDPVVAYFAAHGTVRPEGVDELARLLLDWIDRARPLGSPP
ncbi:hypothetical protein SAMN05444920_119123 [Nonomuraea solani]|uniref:Uncharacterized protein n=1 Tax=Nonomuraea solani TaxID=1144553 RepID=A0A1H6EUY1_9ACTN|nr:DUF6300 family protein [Nonomuraea solani]SEH01193.1 hypothetical protein SAMN05444920_119123 [Nonomuraea solani]